MTQPAGEPGASQTRIDDALAESIDSVLADGFHWLRFPSELEARFLEDSDRRRHPHQATLILVALVAFDVFLIGDYWIIPDIFWFSVRMRLAVITPLGLATILLLRYSRSQWVHELLVTFACVGTTEAMVVFMVKTFSPSASHYYMGVMLPIVYLNTVLQVRFWYGVAGSAVMLAMAAWGLALSPVLTTDVAETATMVVAAACVFTVIALYRLEHEERTTYLHGLKKAWQRAMVERQKEEVERLYQQLRETQARLVQQETLASLGHLVAGVAHEINTPLGTMRLSASVIQQRIDQCVAGLASGSMRRSEMEALLRDLREAGEVVEHASKRTADLVDHFKLLVLDRNSSRIRRFPLAETLGLILQTMTPELRAQNIEVSLSVPPGIDLLGEPGRFEQVIVHLMRNALTHGFAGRDRGRIAIDVHLNEGRMELAFADNGNGIPPNILPKIFEPFFTTRFGQGSSGLGLYSVHNIVTGLFAGRLRVDSAIGIGTTVWIEVPLPSP